MTISVKMVTGKILRLEFGRPSPEVKRWALGVMD